MTKLQVFFIGMTIGNIGGAVGMVFLCRKYPKVGNWVVRAAGKLKDSVDELKDKVKG